VVIQAFLTAYENEPTMHLTFWRDLLQLLEGSVTREALSLWIAPLTPLLLSDSKIVIEAPSGLHERIVRERYLGTLRRCARVLSGREMQIDFVVTESTPPPPSPPLLPEARRRPSPQPSNINRNYTFESFIVGRCNRAAYSAARSVADRCRRRHNPLFITGSVGLGKTHLLQAIGAHLLARGERDIICFPSEQLMDELTAAVGNRTIERGRRRLTSSAILLVDDIHFLSGRNQMQEEFFHIFRMLHQKGRQIVLTSDRPPKEIPLLHQRLVSRFESGSLMSLTPPSLRTRISILEHKAKIFGLKLTPDILVLLASRIRTNIRRMEGALNRIAAHAALSGTEPDREIVERILDERHFDCDEGPITVRGIQKRVAAHFQVKLATMLGSGRRETIVLPRQMAMYLCRKLICAPYADIGAAFSGRDHTTALHACKTIEELCRSNSEAREIMDELVTAIRS